MGPPFLTARALIAATTASGAAVLVVAGTQATGPLGVLAFFAAAVLLTELVQVETLDDSLDPLDAHPVSFSSGVHLAAVLVLGPWVGALVAAFGVVVADGLRCAPVTRIAYNTSVFALASVSAGHAFTAAGGTVGALELPGDLGPVVALAAAYYLVNTVLVGAVIAASSGSPLWPLPVGKLSELLFSAAGEAGLGVLLALSVYTEPWAVVALVPLVLAMYRAHAHLARLRSETARALETFASVVDERDAYTYRHSSRVAEHARRLAQALGFSPDDVTRLRWAGRLHDLGKVAVDAAVIRKAAALDAEEWAAMRRHPRLSARLLRRFRFAREEAEAVEYHHERFDGAGYYGMAVGDVPLAAHFLVVADSYDAMTSDRGYRPGLQPEEALREIEAGAGTQFHPAIAKAFVALERGRDPAAVLSEAERAELGTLFAAPRAAWRDRGRTLARRTDVLVAAGLVAALVAVGFDRPAFALAGLALAVGIGAASARAHFAARSLRALLGRALAPDLGREPSFRNVVACLERESVVTWAALVDWDEDRSAGAVAAAWRGERDVPAETDLTSWLLSEADAGGELVVTAGADRRRRETRVALPLRRDAATVGYLALAFRGSVPRHVEFALRRCADELARGLAEARGDAAPLPRPVAAAT
jgi:putative nucleotidyltransferase with HDIG domain